MKNKSYLIGFYFSFNFYNTQLTFQSLSISMSVMSVKWLSLGGDAGGVGQLEEEQNRGNNIGQRCLYLMCVFFRWIIIVLLTPTQESASCWRTRPRPFSVPTLLREQTWSGVIRGQMITKEKCVTREHDADWNWRTSARLHSKQILKICCWVWGILVLSDNTRIIWLFWTFICSPPRRKKTNHHFETKFLFF